jgi:hypothetical protein
MNLHILEAMFSIGCFVGTIWFMNRLRRMKVVYVMDFQAGVKFIDSGSSKILPPGAYRSSDGGSSILVIDMRPHQFVVERLPYKNALLADSVISVGGELMVSDPQLAVSKLKNFLDDSLPSIREGIHFASSRSLVDASVESRMALAGLILAEVNRRLEANGVQIQNLEITELWAQPAGTDLASVAN